MKHPLYGSLVVVGRISTQNDESALAVQVMIPQADPLFQLKRRLLQRHNLATQQKFQLQRHQVGCSGTAVCQTREM